ncbi:hypothetical protein S7711_09985 [Stachybotrys chartarum IBT 7711]|uniref:Uncharacterized protein n=1 Tax=Stachybotrys chartarum (strain CBS 109288 / IBT 7711) TaxID=1280523 RepID=A0A084BBH2_STACB|nr:hypothetical protein S7711_09985 [Stachybotrys chartarum IBT 7711]
MKGGITHFDLTRIFEKHTIP